jgi:hypothetical protein
MTNPCDIASTNGGHCLTVRTSGPCVSEKAVAGMARSHSGKARRAGIGRARSPAIA